MKRFLLTCALFLLSVPAISQHLPYPLTQKTSHVDVYFGTSVSDPYRWLEDDTSKPVAGWVKDENAVTFDYLGKIPFRDKVKERLTKIWNYPRYGSPFRRGKNYFFFKNDGLQNQSVMYMQENLDAQPEVFFDPNNLSTDGTVALSQGVFSRDGRYFAYAISRSGSDWEEIYLIDVNTGKKMDDQLKWVKFSGISWWKNGFFYSRYDAPSDTAKALSNKNENHKVYYHLLGTDQSKDELIYQDPQHPLELINVGTTEDEHYAALSLYDGKSRGNALYYRDLSKNDSKFLPIIETLEDNIGIVGTAGDKLLLQTDRKAPNQRVVLFDPAHPEESSWKDVLPEKPEVLRGISEVGGKLIATYLKDVSDHVYVYSLDGALENEVTMPTLGTVGGFDGNKDDNVVFYGVVSFTFPTTIYKYDIAKKQSSLYKKPEIDVNVDAYETKQVFYPSKDGTKIPMFIIHKKGLRLDGSNPTFLYGYGGFDISILPAFNPARLAWLEQNGVYAVANIRGGNEYGEQWHMGGMKLNKQNVFDDFIAAAEYLIKEKYTSSSMLTINGASNGGLLIGAVVNQRPDLFRVALPQVGVMDMLRFHKFTIGWSWVSDYGSSDDSIQFRNLVKFSPIQNIREGVEYPAVLVTTADHDDRVVPAHSFKYIATLQEKYQGKNPVLIRIDTKAGHGGGKPTSKVIEETADLYSFAWYNLGITPKY